MLSARSVFLNSLYIPNNIISNFSVKYNMFFLIKDIIGNFSIQDSITQTAQRIFVYYTQAALTQSL